ncbi:Nbl1-Borealin-N domain-containing protein [Mycena kentingensis (nom. inval.)]|nr:Nbl1-Borealin-N domain-containing protein [Mycena kentingensis (nom. inval.)]
MSFTDDEKHHLIANLDIEVDHRRTQLQSWLHGHLQRFMIHQEGLISRIPKQVRTMSMREFAKYDGNYQAALQGVRRERLAAVGETEIDKSTRKRKWVESQEAENDASTTSDKSSKAARLASPEKKPVPPRVRVLSQTAAAKKPAPRTFGSPSPQKSRPPFSTSTQSPRPPSPSKFRPAATTTNAPPRSRVPSVASFNPAVPKTPAYPTGSVRLPRVHESMFSINGSPIANPHEAWQTESGNAPAPMPAPTLKRTKSSILVHRDPSFEAHSRTTSQSHQSTSSSSSVENGHRYAPAVHPTHTAAHERTKSQQQFMQFKFPQLPSTEHALATPVARRPLGHSRSQSTLPITLSTTDGHVLTFDALEASPGQLDALDISDSAKKQARAAVQNLVQAAVNKWTI